MSEHPDIRAIAFTGETSTGKSIMKASASSLKRLSFELGGKNPNIIFADCNLDDVIENTVRSSFLNQGAICLCGSRIYVQSPVYEEFLKRFIDRTREQIVGDPLHPGTNIGAVISQQHPLWIERLGLDEGQQPRVPGRSSDRSRPDLGQCLVSEGSENSIIECCSGTREALLMMGNTDVLIIGAGASGSVAAYHLAKAGFNVRELPIDYPVNTEESDVNPLMYNAVGGGTILYAGQWHRFHPSDFRVRSLDGVAGDWSITYEDLVPFYKQVDAGMDVSGLGGNPAYPEGNKPPLPPLPIGKVGRKAAEGLNKLGWHWWPGYNAIPSIPYHNLNRCALRGTCLTGCAEGAKATMDLVYWPDAIKLGAIPVTGARVKEIQVNEAGLAKGAVYVDRNGMEHFQSASVVIVAANGVGTPRLLLLSRSASFPDGLANSSGLVGRRLMMHPFAVVQGMFDENLESWVGPTGELIHSTEFYETDEKRGFLRGAKWDCMGTGGPLGMRSAYVGRPVGEAWGENFHRSVLKNFGRSTAWGVMAEDLPDEENRVVLDGDPDFTDSDGVASPKVIYKMSDHTRKLMAFHTDKVKEALQASGAIDTVASPLMKDCGWHLLGTARMGDNPETSVVNQWCQTHDVPNLYIIDGSVFVTSAGVNPTATICAIALRAVDHLIRERRNQEVIV